MTVCYRYEAFFQLLMLISRVSAIFVVFALCASEVAFSASQSQGSVCPVGGTSIGQLGCYEDDWSGKKRQFDGEASSALIRPENPDHVVAGQRGGTTHQDICDGGACVAKSDSSRLAELKTKDNVLSENPSPAVSGELKLLAGSYGIVSAVGKAANCEKNTFTLSFNGDQLTFTERNGKEHIEQISKYYDGQLSTQVISSPDERSGTQYTYRSLGGGSLGVRNLRTGNSFTLARCANAAVQGPPPTEKSVALAGQEAVGQEREKQAAKRMAEQEAQNLVQSGGRKRPSGTDAAAVTQCDRLAASSLDVGRLAPGVEITKNSAPAAIASCRDAIANDSDNPRLLYQLARALDAASMIQEGSYFYKKSADRGFPPAQNDLGTMHFTGKGTPQNDMEAARLFKASADQGFASAQNNLGFMYQEGKGVPRNEKESVRLYKMAADQGYSPAQNNLGLMYQEGRGVYQSTTEAARLYKLAADQGLASALNNLATLYLNGGAVEQSDTEAVRLYQLAADQKNPSAQNNLGVMFQTGRGVAQSDIQAARFYQMAADQGFASAQRNLGMMYQSGKGVAQSYTEAVRLYQFASEQGQTGAQAALCGLYRQGLGTSQNFKAAVHLCKIASDKGNISATLSLAEMYEMGEGVDQNYGEALRLYRLAADKNDSYAQFYIGHVFDNGIGVQKNNSEAAYWYKLAARNGNKDAANRLLNANKIQSD